MLLYFLIIAYIYLASILVYKRKLIYQIRKPDRDACYMFFTMGFLLLLNCLRSLYTGNDTISYYKLFRYYSTGYTMEQYSSAGFDWMDVYVDIGWRYINVLFSKISDSYQLFISVIAIFLYLFTTRYIKKNSPNIAISVLLFFLLLYHQYLNVLRQAVAIVIILMSFELLKNKKYIKYSVCILIASLFHKFAVVSFVLIPFYIIKYKKGTARIAILVSAILTVSGAILVFPTFLGYSGAHLNDQTGIKSLFSLVLNSIIFLSSEYLCYAKEIDEDYSEEIDVKITEEGISFYRWINLMAVCLSILEMGLPVMYRVEYFFSVYQIIGLPTIMMSSIKNKKNISIVFLILVIVLIVYRIGIAIYRPEWMTDFPYKFYWQEG